MSKLRIKDAPLLPDVDGAEKIPTGGRGDYAVTLDQVKTFARGGLPQQIEDHINDTENPHQVTKEQVGLGNVDNTRDINKPVSTATQEALDLKANTLDVDNALNLKANIEDVDSALNLKSDKTYVDAQDSLKADKVTTYTKTEVDGSLGFKADKTYVDSQYLLKADKTYVDSALTGFSNGAAKFYPTLAAANADIANIAIKDKVEVGEAVNGGTWYKATAGATSLTKSPYDPLVQAKNYIDSITTTELTTDTNINTLLSGNYFLSTPNLNTLVDAGNFAALGYPADTVKGGGVKINVVRKGTFSYQTLEFTSQGRILTRQGVVGSTFFDWVDVVDVAVSKSQILINQEIAKKFGSIAAGTSLNTFINAGTWGISGAIVLADSKVPAMGYPEPLAAGSAVLTVAQTTSNYAVQELTHGTKKYKRILNRANGYVFEDWQVLGAGITDYVKKGAVATAESLNSYMTEGVYAIPTAVLKAGIESGNLGFPTFFTATGGAILIVAKSGIYPYQMLVGTRQKKIATRQGDGSTWVAWENMLDIVPTVKKTFLAFGSSSFYYMSAKIKTMIESFNATYISDAIGGQILETMQAHQGSNPISIVFNAGVTALNNVASAVTVTQKDDIGSLSAKGSFIVTLSNGLKGTLNLDTNTFTASNATEIYNVGSLSLDVDFGYSNYAQSAYHIFNIGKNNITMGNYTTQQVLDETNKMVDFIKNKGNQNFIVGGHFVDRDMVAAQKQVVLDVNVALKAKYGLKYFDVQDYLMSSQIWTDLNITPTQDDLDKQASGELAVSLSRDDKHLSDDVDTLIVEKLKQKLLLLGYL